MGKRGIIYTMKAFDLVLQLFRPSVLGAIAAGVGIASGLKNIFGGGGGGGSYSGQGPYYSPAGAGSADQQWQDLLARMSQSQAGVQGAIDPVLLQSYLRQLGIDTQPLVQAGQTAGGQYGDIANLQQQYAGILGSQAGNMYGAGQDAYNMGRDPQEALRQRTQQRVVEGSRAASSARGYAMSPYSAGLESQAVGDFNIDWENQQLSRTIQGLDAMIRAGQMGGANLSGSMGFAQQVPQSTLQSATAPMQAAQTAYGFPGQAAMQYAGNVQQGVMQPAANIQSQIIPYLNYGTGATSAGMWGNINQQRQDLATQQAALSNLYGGLGLLNQSYNTPGSWLQNMWGGGTNDPQQFRENAYQMGTGPSFYNMSDPAYG